MSTEPMVRDQMDALICQAPGCTHDDHDGLALVARCHVRSAQIVRYWGDGTIEIRCKTCNKFILSAALAPAEQVHLDARLGCQDPLCQEPPENHKLLLKPACHPNAGLDAVYENGRIVLECHSCEAEAVSLEVKIRAVVA